MARSTQRKTCAKPMHEVQANVASKKIRKSIHALGLAHDVSGASHTVQVNGNSSRNIHCSFCNQGHLVTNCPRHQGFKLNTYEYCLTTANQQDMDDLHDRMKNTNVRKKQGDTTVTPNLRNHSFVSSNTKLCCASNQFVGRRHARFH